MFAFVEIKNSPVQQIKYMNHKYEVDKRNENKLKRDTFNILTKQIYSLYKK